MANLTGTGAPHRDNDATVVRLDIHVHYVDAWRSAPSHFLRSSRAKCALVTT